MARSISDLFNEQSFVRSQVEEPTFDWDREDMIANAIVALVRAQNRLQALHNAYAINGPLPHRLCEEAEVARIAAIKELIGGYEAYRRVWRLGNDDRPREGDDDWEPIDW